MQLNRRRFIGGCGSAVALGFFGFQLLFKESRVGAQLRQMPLNKYGPLLPDPERIVDLPEGFTYRVISEQGQKMDDGFYVPGRHDGMAAFQGPNGKTILIRNHELLPAERDWGPFGWRNRLFRRMDRSKLYDPGKGVAPSLGGTTTLVFDTKTQRLEKEFLSLAGTIRNCAGGQTPWGTWITCEETDQFPFRAIEKYHGFNFEVPASTVMQLADPNPLKAMGRFCHEAVAIHVRTGIVYQTEDRVDGLIYRFIPEQAGVLLRGGRLEALRVKETWAFDTRNWNERHVRAGDRLPVEWVAIENVESPEDDLRYQGRFEKGAARFGRGEGMWADADHIYFVCTEGGLKHKGQIWKYWPSPFEGTAKEESAPGHLELFIEPDDSSLIENADNLAIAPWGDLIVGEDGPDVDTNGDSIVGVTAEGGLYRIARSMVSEFSGICFSPDGSTLFANLYQPGCTLAITGPWNRSA